MKPDLAILVAKAAAGGLRCLSVQQLEAISVKDTVLTRGDLQSNLQILRFFRKYAKNPPALSPGKTPGRYSGMMLAGIIPQDRYLHPN